MTDPRDPLEELPGDLMMWLLIVSELAVFGAGLVAFLAVRIGDPQGFADAQDHLHRASAGVNTLVLVTSGLLAALAAQAAAAGKRGQARAMLVGAFILGCIFLGIKAMEYAANASSGIGVDSGPFFTFYYLLTGFHAAHVIAGVLLLSLVALHPDPPLVETCAAFWHMVDLVWVLLFPVIYLLR